MEEKLWEVISLETFGLGAKERSWENYADPHEQALNAFCAKVRRNLMAQFKACGDTVEVAVDFEIQTISIGEFEVVLDTNRKTGKISGITLEQRITGGPRPDDTGMRFGANVLPVTVVRDYEEPDVWVRYVTLPWNRELDNSNAYDTAFQLNKLYHKAEYLWGS